MEKLIEKYNTLTLKAIEYVKLNRDIEDIVEEKEIILDKIKSLDIDKGKLIELDSKMNFIENDKILKSVILEKRLEIKKKLELMKNRKKMQRSYGNMSNTKTYFNTKI